MKILYLLLPVIVGVALTTQASINGQLRVAVNNPIMATFISFIVGSVFLIGAILVSNQKIPTGTELASIEWYKYTGGILGAFIVLGVILSIKNISPSALFALIVAGQLLTAVLFERFGLLGTSPLPISLSKVIGIILLIAAVYLINRKG